MILTFLLTATPTQTLIDKLGSYSYADRTSAYNELVSMDVKALPELKANMKHPDIEIRLTVRRLLNKIVNPDLSDLSLPDIYYADDKYRYIPYIDLLSPFSIGYWDYFEELRNTAYDEIYRIEKPSEAQTFLFGLVGIYAKRERTYDHNVCAFAMLISDLRWDGMSLEDVRTLTKRWRKAQDEHYKPARLDSEEEKDAPNFGILK